MKHLSCIATADNARYAKLARDDCRVRGTSSLISDYGRDTAHHRFPVRIGEPGDKNVAGFDLL